jgi:excisionase family DNA binding protein
MSAMLTVRDITETYRVSRGKVFRLIRNGKLAPVRQGPSTLRFIEDDVEKALNPAPEERFWSKVRKTGTCWEWTAARGTKGYGAYWADEAMRHAHRYAYELLKGPVPDGLELDHMCHNRACVNPEHLRPVTTKQNQENSGVVLTPSGLRGVYATRGKWRAQVKHQGKCYYNGQYDNLADAEAAAIALRNRLFTHNDHDRKQDPGLLATIRDTGKEHQ